MLCFSWLRKCKWCIEQYLLQPVKFAPVTHLPFHLRGGGPYPVSLKLGLSSQIPVSIQNQFMICFHCEYHTNVFFIPVSNTPTIIWLSILEFLFTFKGNPRKSHDLVVCSWRTVFGNTETTFSSSAQNQTPLDDS